MASPEVRVPPLTLLCSIEIEGSTRYELGQTPLGRRRIVPVTGGRFTGRIAGRVLPGGADWALVRADGSFVPDVRLILEADDGTLISLSYGGRWTATPDNMTRLLRRDGDLTEVDYYWSTLCTFECAMDSSLVWLNGITAVGRGIPTVNGVTYEVFEVGRP